MNPALDREIFIKGFELDALHRVEKGRMNLSPGGKGINVSIALAKLGISSIALGFLGGYMGRILLEELRKVSNLITTNFVHIRGETRENIAIIDEEKHTITEINAPGPEIEPRDLEHLMRRFAMSLSRVEAVVISGSVPANLGPDVYVPMVEMSKEKNVPLFMEIRDIFIKEMYERGVLPNFLKPDFRSQNVLLGEELDEFDDFVRAGKELINRGTEMVVLSYRIDKDIVVTKNGIWLISPKIEVNHAHLLGTGDTYVAAMVYKFIMGERDLLEIASFGYTAALAKTRKAQKELPTLEEIEEIANMYTIERVE